MHGAFRHFAHAECALRVLKNAGYVRSQIEPGSDASGTAPAVLTVDAAATGAARAAEILLDFGAEVRYAPAAAAPLPGVAEPSPQPEKPRNRREARAQAGKRVAAPEEVIIKTRGSDVMPLGEPFAWREVPAEGGA